MIHPADCDCGAYACELRAKAPQISTAGMVRHNNIPPSKPRYNNWEKGKAGERRPNGSFMPYLDKHGSEIPIKKYSEGTFKRDEGALQQARALNTTR